MKNSRVIIILKVAITVLAMVVLFFASRGITRIILQKQNNQQSNQMNAEKKLGTQKDERGTVFFEITPQEEIVNESSQWKFKVVLDTHSVELIDDMIKVAVITGEQGKTYEPVAWEGDAPGGHHREGFLVFDPILPRPKSITLQIKNVGGVVNRDFVWQLN